MTPTQCALNLPAKETPQLEDPAEQLGHLSWRNQPWTAVFLVKLQTLADERVAQARRYAESNHDNSSLMRQALREANLIEEIISYAKRGTYTAS